jgi:hypothetical protein
MLLQPPLVVHVSPESPTPPEFGGSDHLDESTPAKLVQPLRLVALPLQYLDVIQAK